MIMLHGLAPRNVAGIGGDSAPQGAVAIRQVGDARADGCPAARPHEADQVGRVASGAAADVALVHGLVFLGDADGPADMKAHRS